jgi:RNA polymerase-binding transcription factor DksA
MEEVDMTALLDENRLAIEKKRWEAIATHTADEVYTDAQTNFQYRMAQEKKAAIERTQQRIIAGIFGLCDVCGNRIDPERLTLLMDSDCHTCFACAGAAARTSAKVASRPAQRRRQYRTRRSGDPS